MKKKNDNAAEPSPASALEAQLRVTNKLLAALLTKDDKNKTDAILRLIGLGLPPTQVAYLSNVAVNHVHAAVSNRGMQAKEAAGMAKRGAGKRAAEA